MAGVAAGAAGLRSRAGTKRSRAGVATQSLRIHIDGMHDEVTAWLKPKGTQDKGDSSSETQELWILYEYGFDSILNKLEQLRTVLDKMQLLLNHKDVLESKPISELFKESQENLTRIKLETKITLDEIEEARETDEVPPRISMEAVKGAMGSDELPERISASADTKLEIEQAN